MKSFCLFEHEMISDIFCECSALNGIKRIAGTISEDLFMNRILKILEA